MVRGIARFTVDRALRRPQAAGQKVVDALRAARGASRITGWDAHLRERIVEGARERPHLGRLDGCVEVAGDDDRSPEVFGDPRQRLGLGASLSRAGIREVSVDDAYARATAGESAEVASPKTTFEPMSLDEIERRHIHATLRATGWNKSRTAAILGVERSTLDRKIRRYDLKPPNIRADEWAE